MAEVPYGVARSTHVKRGKNRGDVESDWEPEAADMAFTPCIVETFERHEFCRLLYPRCQSCNRRISFTAAIYDLQYDVEQAMVVDKIYSK